MRFDLCLSPDYHPAMCRQYFLALTASWALFTSPALAETFRVAAYNVENYLDQTTESRKFVKSPAAKAKVRETILALKPDVIAFEEMGGLGALLELRDALKKDGLDLPHYEHVTGFDTNIHVAVLSRFPIIARRAHTNDSFLLSGRRFRVSRGFTDVDIQVNANYQFTLIGAHLKSRRAVPEADEAELRHEEARILRAIVDQRLAADPKANLVVLGDFNDTYNAKSVKEVVGRGAGKLVDTRPAERNGDNQPNPVNPHYYPRNITWTHFYGVEDTYSRIDYLMLSPGMAREWDREETYIPTIPNWGTGSDHRPLLATFAAENQ
ncbi:MAG: endonuclease/exonuclease/phosphatase family protein [Verrucomicrobia bacterium]|nr:endonuclease/exonuclease/phosphatase family protein [Verrucomicrobiota bacterium]